MVAGCAGRPSRWLRAPPARPPRRSHDPAGRARTYPLAAVAATVGGTGSGRAIARTAPPTPPGETRTPRAGGRLPHGGPEARALRRYRRGRRPSRQMVAAPAPRSGGARHPRAPTPPPHRCRRCRRRSTRAGRRRSSSRQPPLARCRRPRRNGPAWPCARPATA